MKLYLVRISPGSRIVWLYCLLNKVPIEIIDVDMFAGENKSQAFLELNPTGEVPVLVDGKATVFEPVAILIYLATKYTNNQGFGKNIQERYNVLSLLTWTSTRLHDVMGYRVVYPNFVEAFRLCDENANESYIEKGTVELAKELEVLENQFLLSNNFLVSGSATVADLYVATTLLQLEWIDFDFHLWPRLERWLATVKSTPHWMDVHQQHGKFVQELL